MKGIKHINFWAMLVISSLSLVGCSSEDEIAQHSGDGGNVLATTSCYMEDTQDSITRSSLTYNISTKGLDFKWEKGDQMVIFSKAKGASKMNSYYGIFSIQESSAGQQVAEFTGEQTFENDNYYYAFCPRDLTNTSPDPENLSLSYENQTQVGNDNTDHLGKFDYQSSFGTLDSDSKLHLKMQHLGAVLRIKMLMPEECRGVRYKTLTIKTVEANDFSLNRTINIITDATDANSYNPAFNSLIASDQKAEFSLNLKGTDGNPGISQDDEDFLYMFVSIPSGQELYGKQMYAVLTPVDDSKDSYMMPLWVGKNYEKGTCYTIGRVAAKTTDAIIEVNVYKKWQNGADVSVTRVDAGDPGNEDVYAKPTNLLLFICKDGVVYEKKPISGIPSSDWQDMGERYYYSPRLKVEFETAPTKSFHVYAVASDRDMTSLIEKYKQIKPGINETDLVKYIYNVDGTDFADKQKFLKNLYSVPYGIDGDNGNNGRSDDPNRLSVSCNLYHVAAKVDLNWEGTPRNGDVAPVTLTSFTVSNLPTSGYLFQPTENAVAKSGDTYTYTTNTGDALYGRDYFYAIQQKNSSSQFPLTISWTPSSFSTKTSITFTPSFENGCTSWLKANISDKK